MARSLSFYPSAASLLLTLPAILGLVMLPVCMAGNILGTGETLYAGGCLKLGSYTFCMTPSCDLVLSDSGNRVWHSDTSSLGRVCHLTMQKDGNLVIYTTNGNPVWQSNTARGNGYYILVLQTNGNVVVYGPAIWATNTYRRLNVGGVSNSSTAGFAAVNAAGEDGNNIAMANNILLSGDTLYAGYCLESGSYTFCMQPSCDLVLNDGRNRVWESNTTGKGAACHLTLENNGNLVMYDSDGLHVVWESDTAGANGSYILVVQSDRNVVVYGPAIWKALIDSSTAGFAHGNNIAMVAAN